MIRNQFNKDYIENELQKLSTLLRRRTRLFVAGGAAMAFYGLKEATKDIDVVVERRSGLHSLMSALRTGGYAYPKHGLGFTYTRMRAKAILENGDGFRWDIFERVIANKLSLSKGMVSKSHVIFNKAKLHVRSLSKEDIFLLKSVTERDFDLDDMRIVAESGIDWNRVKTECHSQASRSERIWEDALCEKLIDLRERMNVVSPIEKSICRIADQRILERWIIKRVGAGVNTVNDLAREAGEPKWVIRKALAELVEKRDLGVKREGRLHTFALATRAKRT